MFKFHQMRIYLKNDMVHVALQKADNWIKCRGHHEVMFESYSKKKLSSRKKPHCTGQSLGAFLAKIQQISAGAQLLIRLRMSTTGIYVFQLLFFLVKYYCILVLEWPVISSLGDIRFPQPRGRL